MPSLTHYVVVRRDLPFGYLCAQIAHAAGESFYQASFRTWTVPSAIQPMASGMIDMFPRSSTSEHQTFSLEAGGSIPSGGATFNPSETIAVVLGARNESKLLRLVAQLRQGDVQHVAIRELDGEYAGQVVAVGIVPCPKEHAARYVRDFHLLPDRQEPTLVIEEA